MTRIALALACLTFAAQAEWEVIETRKIWDAAPHSAFTDLTRHAEAWWCVFREGSAHVPGTNGKIRVLRSSDLQTWESAALLAEEGIDLRDPKITAHPDGRLMLLAGGSVYPGDENLPNRRRTGAATRVFFSGDGKEWTKPQPVSLGEGEWLWRVTWHDGAGYGVAYNVARPHKDFVATLWKTSDGVNYEKVAQLNPPCWPNETTLRFALDGTLHALVRGEQPDKHAIFGTSKAPYTDWQWIDASHAAQGPNFLVPPTGRFFYAGRDLEGGAKTVVGEIRDGRCVPQATLPSGGDCSYPGLVWQRGELIVSYYSSHEGKAAIYLARLRP
jgi:hypothetical protein